MSRQPRLGSPPAALHKARLDNLALLPGSALAQITRYQKMANELPDGGVLIVSPSKSPKQKQALLAVAKLLGEHGHHVRVISAAELSQGSESTAPPRIVA